MKRSIHSILSIFLAILLAVTALFPMASASNGVFPYERSVASPAYFIRQFNVHIDPKGYVTLSSLLYLQAGSYVEFHGTYSPTTSSLKCGILTPEWDFYSVAVSGGSYDIRIEISISGQYYLAIENTSNTSVETSGHYIY